jgi:hypothetical protein
LPFGFGKLLIGDQVRMLFSRIVPMRSVAPSFRDPQLGPVFVSVFSEPLTQLGDFRAESHAQGVDGSRFVVQRLRPPFGCSSHILDEIHFLDSKTVACAQSISPTRDVVKFFIWSASESLCDVPPKIAEIVIPIPISRLGMKRQTVRFSYC